MVLLHELAHALHGRSGGTSHGRHYSRILLEIVGHQLGKAARSSLIKWYKAKGVKYTPRPVFSEETRARMRARGIEMAIQNGWEKRHGQQILQQVR